MRPNEWTPAEAYPHGLLGGRPAEGGDACLHGGLQVRQPELGLHDREGGLWIGMGDGRQLVILGCGVLEHLGCCQAVIRIQTRKKLL